MLLAPQTFKTFKTRWPVRQGFRKSPKGFGIFQPRSRRAGEVSESFQKVSECFNPSAAQPQQTPGESSGELLMEHKGSGMRRLDFSTVDRFLSTPLRGLHFSSGESHLGCGPVATFFRGRVPDRRWQSLSN